MGINSSSNTKNSPDAISQRYNTSNLPYILDKQTRQPYFLYQVICNSPQNANNILQNIQQYQKNYCQSITKFKQWHNKKSNEYCSEKDYYYAIFYGHQNNNVKDQYQKRRVNGLNFSCEELRDILESTLCGVRQYNFRFARNHPNFSLEDVCIEQNSHRIYVRDPWLTFRKSISVKIQNFKTSFHQYSSPEKLQAIYFNKSEIYDYFQSSLFTIGIFGLQLYFMQNMDDLYDSRTRSINFNLLQSRLQQIDDHNLRNGLLLLLSQNNFVRSKIYQSWNIKCQAIRKLFPRQYNNQKFEHLTISNANNELRPPSLTDRVCKNSVGTSIPTQYLQAQQISHPSPSKICRNRSISNKQFLPVMTPKNQPILESNQWNITPTTIKNSNMGSKTTINNFKKPLQNSINKFPLPPSQKSDINKNKSLQFLHKNQYSSQQKPRPQQQQSQQIQIQQNNNNSVKNLNKNKSQFYFKSQFQSNFGKRSQLQSNELNKSYQINYSQQKNNNTSKQPTQAEQNNNSSNQISMTKTQYLFSPSIKNMQFILNQPSKNNNTKINDVLKNYVPEKTRIRYIQQQASTPSSYNNSFQQQQNSHQNSFSFQKTNQAKHQSITQNNSNKINNQSIKINSQKQQFYKSTLNENIQKSLDVRDQHFNKFQLSKNETIKQCESGIIKYQIHEKDKKNYINNILSNSNSLADSKSSDNSQIFGNKKWDDEKLKDIEKPMKETTPPSNQKIINVFERNNNHRQQSPPSNQKQNLQSPQNIQNLTSHGSLHQLVNKSYQTSYFESSHNSQKQSPNKQILYQNTPYIQPNQIHKNPSTIIEVNEQGAHSQSSQAQKEEYVSEQYESGSRYQGYKKNGMRNGRGKFYYQDGGHYEGQWKDNKMHGWGQLFYEDGRLAYEGFWSEDQFNGYGKVYNDNPTHLPKGFDYTNFDLLDDYWQFYEGSLVSDTKQGHGIIKLTNGQIFEGDFHSDRIQGYGKYKNINGSTIEGIWKDSRLVKILNNN